MKQLKELKLNDTVLTADEVEQKINSAVSGGTVGDDLCVTRVCATIVRAGSTRANQAEIVGGGLLTFGLNENGVLSPVGPVLKVNNYSIVSQGVGGRGSFFFNSGMSEANQVARMVEVNNAIKTALANYKPSGSGGVSSDEFNDLVSQVGGKADKNHSHAIGCVTGLTDMLAGKAPVEHTHAVKDVSGLTGAIAILDTGKADKSHTHAIGDVTGLTECLTAIKGSVGGGELALRVDAICSSLDNKANSSHTHVLADIPKFSDEIERIKGELAAGTITLERFQELAAEVNGKAERSHTHDIGGVEGLTDKLALKADKTSLESVCTELDNTKASKEEVASLRSSLGSLASDRAVVHLAGAETITGVKTFCGGVNIGCTHVASNAGPGELRFFNDSGTQQISLKRNSEGGVVITTSADGDAEEKCWIFAGDSGAVATKAYVDANIPTINTDAWTNAVYVCANNSSSYVDIANVCNRGVHVDVSGAGSGCVTLGVLSHNQECPNGVCIVCVKIATADRVAAVENRLDDLEENPGGTEGSFKVDKEITATSTNPVTSQAIYTVLLAKQGTLTAGDYINIDRNNKISVVGLTPGENGTVGGDYATTEYVTGAIATAKGEIQADLTENYYAKTEIEGVIRDLIPQHTHDMDDITDLPSSLDTLPGRVAALENSLGTIRTTLEAI